VEKECGVTIEVRKFYSWPKADIHDPVLRRRNTSLIHVAALWSDPSSFKTIMMPFPPNPAVVDARGGSFSDVRGNQIFNFGSRILGAQ
jgi:hypothetical protein